MSYLLLLPSQNALDAYCFVLFACVCLLGCLYTFFILPETKGKTLLEISEDFKNITVCQKFVPEEITETKLWSRTDSPSEDHSDARLRLVRRFRWQLKQARNLSTDVCSTVGARLPSRLSIPDTHLTAPAAVMCLSPRGQRLHSCHLTAINHLGSALCSLTTGGNEINGNCLMTSHVITDQNLLTGLRGRRHGGDHNRSFAK